MMNCAMSVATPLPVAARTDPKHDAAHNAAEPASLDQQLWRLLDLLLVIRLDLSSGLMPRAARITGTAATLQLVVNRIDAAIGLAKEASALLEAGLVDMNEDASKHSTHTSVARRHRPKIHGTASKGVTRTRQSD